MRLIHLFELRSHPELNPKIPSADELLKYKGKPNLYVSFSYLPKIGINPESGFDTPIGVYAYPLDFVFKNLGDTKFIQGAVPFAGNRMYLHILQAIGNGLDLNTVDDALIIKTSDTLEKVYSQFSDKIVAALGKAAQSANTPPRRWWYFTHNVASALINDHESQRTMVAWNKILRVLGYDYIVDHGNGIIHGNEPTQAVFLSPKGYKEIDIITNRDSKQYKSMGMTRFESDSAKKEFIKKEYDKRLSLRGVKIGLRYNTLVFTGGSVALGDNLYPTTLANCSFISCKISKCYLRNSLIKNSTVAGAKASDCQFIGCTVNGTQVTSGSSLHNCTMKGGKLLIARAKNSSIDADSDNSYFENCVILGGHHEQMQGENNTLKEGIVYYHGDNPISKQEGGEVNG